jgi:PHD/YefM family antitoxin component YafN of YafNO toxin-antitoxin module
MARVVTAGDLRTRLEEELDSLKVEADVLYVSKRGKVVGVLIDNDRYTDLLGRLEFLEDSLTAILVRQNAGVARPWTKVRRSSRRPMESRS